MQIRASSRVLLDESGQPDVELTLSSMEAVGRPDRTYLALLTTLHPALLTLHASPCMDPTSPPRLALQEYRRGIFDRGLFAVTSESMIAVHLSQHIENEPSTHPPPAITLAPA